MSTETRSFAKRPEAVGRILDERGSTAEILVQLTDAGFVVHGFELKRGREQPTTHFVSIVIEAVELNTAMAAATPTPEPAVKQWWR